METKGSKKIDVTLERFSAIFRMANSKITMEEGRRAALAFLVAVAEGKEAIAANWLSGVYAHSREAPCLKIGTLETENECWARLETKWASLPH